MSKTNENSALKETLKTVAYAIVIALAVRTVAFEPFNIPSGSMIPTLDIGDYVFVKKWSYGYSSYSLPLDLPLFKGRIFAHMPKRGDVVVFRYPRDPSEDYIKRVIGLPGDVVQMKLGRLYINGKEVPERQIADFVMRGPHGNVHTFHQFIETLPGGCQHRIITISPDMPFNNTPPYVVPAGHFFMMGDNRDDSDDSRDKVGMVPFRNLVGKAVVVFFSVRNTVPFLEVWKWPSIIRWDRMFHLIAYHPPK